MTTEWDRSKQTYFILRRGNPWSVMTADGRRKVCDYPAYYSSDEVARQICFAPDDNAVKLVVGAIPERKVVQAVMQFTSGAITDHELYSRVRECDGRSCLPLEFLSMYDKWCEENPTGPNLRTFAMGSYTIVKPIYTPMTAEKVKLLNDTNPFELLEFALMNAAQAISAADGFSAIKTATGITIQATDVDTEDSKTGKVSHRNMIFCHFLSDDLNDRVLWENYNPGSNVTSVLDKLALEKILEKPND